MQWNSELPDISFLSCIGIFKNTWFPEFNLFITIYESSILIINIY